MEEIKIDEKELCNQLLEELEKQEHAFIIKIGVPAITFEKMLIEKNIDTIPIANIHSTKGGTNAITRAFAVVVLKETFNDLLNDKDTAGAYALIKNIIETKTVEKKFEEDEDDTNGNTKG